MSDEKCPCVDSKLNTSLQGRGKNQVVGFEPTTSSVTTEQSVIITIAPSDGGYNPLAGIRPLIPPVCPMNDDKDHSLEAIALSGRTIKI
jgi:hypothetical protein